MFWHNEHLCKFGPHKAIVNFLKENIKRIESLTSLNIETSIEKDNCMWVEKTQRTGIIFLLMFDQPIRSHIHGLYPIFSTCFLKNISGFKFKRNIDATSPPTTYKTCYISGSKDL